ncbi:histidine kinase [Acidimicrobium ferrooxidans DSM 10331]|uniref:histidine kinase n=1 Tax=Acidimicrobium ferrooxidans (strain DSM 10331 / JCM 15462 / NBRC 103882 / ICP) TaxID=525909 RepID=C7M0J1_ACIFD|nr:ATP-binding cassette domain-containing protein [Acidimicrobium ferrooxidans]ACU54499.1 histidine kinase [Acidimicrobium ferrooxidans DSM 10331]
MTPKLEPVVAAALDGDARALDLRGLRVGYGSVVVLDDVSLVIHPGELVGLVGDNGAGKTTLVKAIAGELAIQAGSIQPRDRDVAVVWQDVELVESLSIAENLVLGREGRRLVSPRRTHAAAHEVLARVGLAIDDLSRPLRTLSGGQRRLVAIARQVAREPDYLLLDEPTASLGALEAAAVMALVARIRERGVGVLLVSHDLGLVASASDRVVVLHHGKVVATVDGGTVGPEELGELIVAGSSQESSRRQLARFASLVEQVAAIDEGTGVTAITAACSVALGAVPVAALLGESMGALRVVSAHGLDPLAQTRLEQAIVDADGPIAEALTVGAARDGELELDGERRSLWAVPMLGPRGAIGVLAVIVGRPLEHDRTRAQLASLYAATIATTVERERVLHALEQRNHVLEVLQRFLEVLAGGARVEPALDAALSVLKDGLGAVELELVEGAALIEARLDRVPGTLARVIELDGAESTALLATLGDDAPPDEAAELLSAAASSVRLALERRRVEQAEREAAALRRSQALQVAFVQRLSHELRTPLTAITGYASSLLAEDVRWDTESERRFLQRIVAESQRLARLVGDLLDLSAIESGTLRVRRDWAEVAYIVEAAVACVPEVVVDVDLDDVPPVFVDHDRIEQVLVNLLHNAASHNPPGTHVRVTARRDDDGGVVIAVEDDGAPLPAGVSVEELAQRHREGTGNGLGLAISSSIVAAHGGVLRLVPRDVGKRFEVQLPEADEAAADAVLGMERS